VALPALSALPAAALATGLDPRDEHLLRVELLTIRQLLEI
jgi:hypothetical protein